MIKRIIFALSMAFLAGCNQEFKIGDGVFTLKPQCLVQSITINIDDVESGEKIEFIKDINEWNKLLKYKHFNLVSRLNATINVHSVESFKEANILGCFYSDDNSIDVLSGLRLDYQPKVFYHEMGHSLGLEHNAEPDSIMPEVADGISYPSPRDVSRARENLGL